VFSTLFILLSFFKQDISEIESVSVTPCKKGKFPTPEGMFHLLPLTVPVTLCFKKQKTIHNIKNNVFNVTNHRQKVSYYGRGRWCVYVRIFRITTCSTQDSVWHCGNQDRSYASDAGLYRLRSVK
jgi:hypothetical protein